MKIRNCPNGHPCVVDKDTDFPYFHVRCTNNDCDWSQDALFGSEEYAIKAWNERAVEDRYKKALEEIKERAAYGDLYYPEELLRDLSEVAAEALKEREDE